MIDHASIRFEIIRHHEHNFHLFSEKSTASIAAENCHLLIMQQFFWPDINLRSGGPSSLLFGRREEKNTPDRRLARDHCYRQI